MLCSGALAIQRKAAAPRPWRRVESGSGHSLRSPGAGRCGIGMASIPTNNLRSLPRRHKLAAYAFYRLPNSTIDTPVSNSLQRDRRNISALAKRISHFEAAGSIGFPIHPRGIIAALQQVNRPIWQVGCEWGLQADGRHGVLCGISAHDQLFCGRWRFSGSVLKCQRFVS